MIDIAIITGIYNLNSLASLGTIEMALTHLVLKYPEYASYYKNQSDAGKWVILDNNAYELEFITGQGLPAEKVLKAAELISPSELICQDILYDGAKTVESTKEFIKYTKSESDDSYSLMGVPQGKNENEWLNCYTKLVEISDINTIGLSKLSVPVSWNLPVAESRLKCLDEITKIGIPKPLHLLGADRSLPWELEQLRTHKKIRSNDSSFAYRYVYDGISIDVKAKRAKRQISPRKSDFELSSLNDELLEEAINIVKLLKKCAGITESEV